MKFSLLFLFLFLLVLTPSVSTDLVIDQLDVGSTVNIFQGNLTNLSQLEDTNIPSPSDNDVLTFDSASGKWVDDVASAVGDTNETTRFNDLTNNDCSSGELVIGVQNNGTVLCATDVGGTDTNETTRFNDLTNNDCSSGELVIGVQDNGTVLCVTDSDSGSVNIFDQVLNTTSNVTHVNLNVSQLNVTSNVGTDLIPFLDSLFNFGSDTIRWLYGFFDQIVVTTGNFTDINTEGINSTDWLNVTINEDQINDLFHNGTTDTNETTRFNALDSTDCPSGQVVSGVQANGTVTCVTDANDGAVNIFDQVVNTTSNVTFRNINVTDGWTNVTITESQITDLFHNGTTDTNETTRFNSLTDNDCSAGEFGVGTQANGTILCSLAISSDATWVSNSSAFNKTWSSITNTSYLTEETNWNSNSSAFNSTWSSGEANETGRFNFLTDNDCSSGELVIGVQNNGTVLCASDLTSGAFNLSNQEVNTTSNVTFNTLNVTTNIGTDLIPFLDSLFDFGTDAIRWFTGYFDRLVVTDLNTTTINTEGINSTDWKNFTGTESQIIDLFHNGTTDTNETVTIQNNNLTWFSTENSSYVRSDISDTLAGDTYTFNTNLSIAGATNYTNTGIVRTFANGCVEIANATGIFWVC